MIISKDFPNCSRSSFGNVTDRPEYGAAVVFLEGSLLSPQSRGQFGRCEKDAGCPGRRGQQLIRPLAASEARPALPAFRRPAREVRGRMMHRPPTAKWRVPLSPRPLCGRRADPFGGFWAAAEAIVDVPELQASACSRVVLAGHRGGGGHGCLLLFGLLDRSR